MPIDPSTLKNHLHAKPTAFNFDIPCRTLQLHTPAPHLFLQKCLLPLLPQILLRLRLVLTLLPMREADVAENYNARYFFKKYFLKNKHTMTVSQYNRGILCSCKEFPSSAHPFHAADSVRARISAAVRFTSAGRVLPAS